MGKGRVTKKTDPYGVNEIALRNWARVLNTKSNVNIERSKMFRIVPKTFRISI